MKNRVLVGAGVLAVSVGLGGASARAGTIFSFAQLTSNGGGDVAGQLSMEVEVHASGHVDFTFRNSGPAASSITGIFFDGGTVLGLGGVIGGTGSTVFATGAGLGNLPGGNEIDFNATAGFLSSPPRVQSGIGPGESLTIRFDLVYGQSAHDPLTAITLALANPGVDMSDGLRVGLHVQGYSGGQSESFVVSPAGVVPLPGASAMGLVGLGVLAGRRRRGG